MAADPNKLKEYLKQDIQSALGIRIDSVEFDRVMGAFASAIDRYLKQDITVGLGIESRGELELPTTSIPSGPNPTVAKPTTIVNVKSRTTGKLE
jgi:hypothetical protein